MTTSPVRTLRVAELLSVGSELTVGETRDTNSGEIARELTRHGVRVARIQALPDHLETVRDAYIAALAEADLVISTGGLGPTPDDLTRESIAAALGEQTAINPKLEAWLRELWSRRNIRFASINLKQAWLIPSATPIPNQNGTAPGWWVDAPGGRVIVALPGPPREMRPMWADWVVPRLSERGIGSAMEIRTLRTTGIGESQLAELLGEPLLRATNPVVATYARQEAVDIRISAVGTVADNGPARTAAQLADSVESLVLDLVDKYVWARGETTWAQAIDQRLETLGWTLATAEIGTRGALTSLLSEMDRLVLSEAHTGGEGASAPPTGTIRYDPRLSSPILDDEVDDALALLAQSLRERASTDVALAVRMTVRGQDSSVEVAIATANGVHHERRLSFLQGATGRNRAAITGASLLLSHLPVRKPA